MHSTVDMPEPSVPRLILKRLTDQWKLLASVFTGIAIATSIGAATPIYLDSLEELSFDTSLDQLPGSVLTIGVSAPEIPLTSKSLAQADRTLDQAVDRNLSDIYLGRETFLQGSVSLVGIPQFPLPEGNGKGVLVTRGYFQSLSNLETNARFIDGRNAGGDISSSPVGPEIEAVVSVQTARRFEIDVGDEVVASPSLASSAVVTALIVGILEPDDPTSPQWSGAEALLDPPPLTEPTPVLVQVDPLQAPAALFVNEQVLFQIVDELESVAQVGDETYIRSPAFLVGLPSDPLPLAGGTGVIASRGYLQHLSNLEQHSEFLDGRMAGDSVSMGPDGPELEAVVSRVTARNHQVGVDDVVTVSPALGEDKLISATIVGIVNAHDIGSPYWSSAGLFLEPGAPSAPPPLLVQVDPEETPLALFVTKPAMIEAVLQAYPGTLVQPTWVVQVDKRAMRRWTISEARERLARFETDMRGDLPDAFVGTGIVQGLTDEGLGRSFFSRVPLLLLLTVVVATVLFFLSMMVSYLAQSREGDAAMLRTRGVGSLQLLRLYGVEGLAMIVVAVVAAPFIAMGAVAAVGTLPQFREITDGATLPVSLGPVPFLVAIGIGVLCLAIFALPAALGAHGGIQRHRLLTARPPSVPLAHRYYLDVAVLSIGAIAFWELNKRGSLVSGGLFDEVKVNETLLLAPVLFLLVVALLFMRLFPMVMRYVSGESPTLVHVLAAGSVVATVATITAREVRDGEASAAAAPVAVILGLGLAYWATVATGARSRRLVGLAAQAALVWGFLQLEPLETGETLFVPSLALLSLVPAQLAFHLLRAVVRVAPVWVSMVLWRMSRSPLQYTWLVLLLVMVTGTGILATTVGGTLEKGQRDRIRYDVGSELRVAGVDIRLLRGVDNLREEALTVRGVEAAAQAYRESGTVGASTVEVLAVESDELARIAFYRDDFSDRSLAEVMRELRPGAGPEPLAVPDDADGIAVWAKPLQFAPFIGLYVMLGDEDGTLHDVFLGQLGLPEWTLMLGRIPPDLERPLHVVSVEIFEGGFSAEGSPSTAGTLLLDDLQVTIGPSGEQQVLEDFEAELKWSPIRPTAVAPDRLTATTDDVYNGARSGSFSFGNVTEKNFRGFYRPPTDGPLPVILSSSLAEANGYATGDSLAVSIAGQWVPVVIKGTVDYFPTLGLDGGDFMIMDLDSLFGHLNVIFDFFRVRPGEVFVKIEPGAKDAVRQDLREVIGRFGDLRDGVSQLEDLRLDPFISAGWRPMVVLSVVVGVVAAAFGYVSYLLLFAGRGESEIVSMMSIGLSRWQRTVLLGLEHIAIAAIGVALGTWAGFQTSELMVSPLAVTNEGAELVPPFILTTEWPVMAPAYLALLAVFLVALVVLNRGIGRLDVRVLARAEG